MDFKFAIRTLMRRPGFVVVAVVTMALGIGANTAVFSIVDNVLLKPLPYPNPDRLVVISETSKAVPETLVSYPDYLDWKSESTSFESLAARMPAGFVFTGDGEPERIVGRWVTASFFETLGVQPQLGRAFTELEDTPSAERVVVLGYGLWQRRYGGDPAVIGRSIQINAEPWTVIGVMPANFDFYGRLNVNNDFLVPLGRLGDRSYMRNRTAHPASVVARLKPGKTIRDARTEMNAIAVRLEEQFSSSNSGVGISMRLLSEDYLGNASRALMVISAAVVLVLLIACANVANLLLARGAGRQKEIAIRLALGATRARIVRQLLTESLVLAVAGGAVGLLFAGWCFGTLMSLADALPRSEEVTMDTRVLVFTLLSSVMTGAIFGVVPALQISKTDLQTSLKEGGRTSGSGSGERLRAMFVVAEIALSFVLLVGGGLLLKSFRELLRVDLGFEPKNVLTVRLRLPDAKYKESSQTMAFCREALRRVEELPGVEHASLSTGFPFGQSGDDDYLIEGESEPAAGEAPVAITHYISADYQRTLGIRLIAGRFFTDQDNETAPLVAIVDEEFVRRHFAGGSLSDVIGKRVRLGGVGEPWREIVGVVKHVKHSTLDEQPRPEIDRPYAQIEPRWLAEYTRVMDLSTKTTGDPLSFVAAIKNEVQSIDKDQPLANVSSYEHRMSEEFAPRRFNLALVGLFAIIAMVLAAVGVYGLMSHMVTSRTQEIGIRMALGAQTSDVFGLILRRGLKLTLLGVAIGLVGALALTRMMSSMLFEVSTRDPWIMASIAGLLGFVAFAACFVPATKATRVDPMAALKCE
jgi:putative ABC transport system permease protein